MRSIERRLIQYKIVKDQFEDNRPYEIEGLNAIELANDDNMSGESDSVDSSFEFSDEDLDFDVSYFPLHMLTLLGNYLQRYFEDT